MLNGMYDRMPLYSASCQAPDDDLLHKSPPAADESRGVAGACGRVHRTAHDRLIALHKNATTTPATRAAIQAATGSDYALTAEFGLSRDTIRKWRKL